MVVKAIEILVEVLLFVTALIGAWCLLFALALWMAQVMYGVVKRLSNAHRDKE